MLITHKSCDSFFQGCQSWDICQRQHKVSTWWSVRRKGWEDGLKQKSEFLLSLFSAVLETFFLNCILSFQIESELEGGCTWTCRVSKIYFRAKPWSEQWGIIRTRWSSLHISQGAEVWNPEFPRTLCNLAPKSADWKKNRWRRFGQCDMRVLEAFWETGGELIWCLDLLKWQKLI